jgi:hypothetical protein
VTEGGRRVEMFKGGGWFCVCFAAVVPHCPPLRRLHARLPPRIALPRLDLFLQRGVTWRPSGSDMVSFIVASEHTKSGLADAKTEAAALRIMDQLLTRGCATCPCLRHPMPA